VKERCVQPDKTLGDEKKPGKNEIFYTIFQYSTDIIVTDPCLFWRFIHNVETYAILTLGDQLNLFDDLYHIAQELKYKAPQINWIVGEEKILQSDNKYEAQLCIKVPTAQLEAAKYLYSLIIDCKENEFLHNQVIHDLEENLAYLAQSCSFAVKYQDVEEYFSKLSTILSELYTIATQLPKGINLHLNRSEEEAYEPFPRTWIVNMPHYEKQVQQIQENICFIFNKNAKFSSISERENSLFTAGMVFQTYQSFHAQEGWGIRLVETLKLIHLLKHLLGKKEEPAEHNTKERATLWIKELIANADLLEKHKVIDYEQLTLFEVDDQNLFSFPLIGFADEPSIYVQPTMDGIQFGYHSIYWEGHEPIPTLKKKQLLSWESLASLSHEQQEELVVELLLKTITSRKRQYQTCQFCGEKVSPEHLFNKKTCHGCATEHFGVVY